MKSVSRLKLLGVIILCLVCYNEWLSFVVKSTRWLRLHQTNESISILLVADPQILSTLSEPHYPLSIPAIWDANRFVSKAYSYAVQHTQPDVVIYLGDLINDGSIASEDEFVNLVANFKNLIPRPASAKAVFYIAGDNDVGGEGSDFVTNTKITRFESSFNCSDVISYRYLDIYHMNNIYGSPSSMAKNASGDKKRYSIIVSHYAITPATRKELLPKIIDIAPGVLFSAHDHDSYRFVSMKENPRAHQFHLLRADQSSKLELKLDSTELNEISVPTCSYRMGKLYYGFGHAVLRKNDNVLEYCVLWLPSRFGQLLIYGILLCFCCAFYMWPCVRYLAQRYELNRSKIHRV